LLIVTHYRYGYNALFSIEIIIYNIFLDDDLPAAKFSKFQTTGYKPNINRCSVSAGTIAGQAKGGHISASSFYSSQNLKNKSRNFCISELLILSSTTERS
jgi:hypothetical protein